MKPTYLAAALAAAVTLTGMSTPAHAAFTKVTVGGPFYDPDLGVENELDTIGDEVTFTWTANGSGTMPAMNFKASSPELLGGGFGLIKTDFSEVKFGEITLNGTQVVSSGSEGTFGFVAGVFQENNNLEIEIISTGGDEAFGDVSLSAVPLPAAAWLMIGGLGALGAYGRRARRTTAASA